MAVERRARRVNLLKPLALVFVGFGLMFAAVIALVNL